jgi:transcriptional regulator with XRE-family HTH domain
LDRRDFAAAFRTRLEEAMARAGVSRAALAAQVGIDRSTLSLLLSPDHDRLPRADTVASIAAALQVSLDWLLGLSKEAKLGADILLESMEIAPSAATPSDERLERWHEEAKGYKIRYVPTTLPDLAKTDEVLAHEYRDFVAKSADRAISASQQRLAYSRRPETDMEICISTQAIGLFARGQGMWEGLPDRTRREQLERLIALTDELYPTLRLFMFNGRTHYSVPYTVFGPLRASLYIGQSYFVFNTTEHIRALTSHFDSLIRAAVVQANEATDFLRGQLNEVGASPAGRTA